MEGPERPVVRCEWCRKRMSEREETCPHCGRPVAGLLVRGERGSEGPGKGVPDGDSQGLRPLGGEVESGAPAEPEDKEPGDPWAQEQAERRRPREKAALRVRGRGRTPEPARDRSYDVEPVAPAEGQQYRPGSWQYLKAVARADKLFGVLLGIMAAQVVLAYMVAGIFSTLIAGLLFWGVATLTWWGYLIVMIGAGFRFLYLTGMLVAAELEGRIGTAPGIYTMALWAVNLFIMLVLYTRRQHFT